MEPSKFIAKLNKEGGLARANRYKVQVIPPAIMSAVRNIGNLITNPILTGFNALSISRYFAMLQVNPLSISENLEILCDSCVLPGANFETTERKIYGPHNSVPYDQNFEPIAFTFICGANMKERYFFDAWQYMVKDPVSNDYNYQSEYATSVIIKQYSIDGDFKYGVRLVDAWPVNVNSIELTYADEEICRVNVELSFKTWYNLKAYDTLGSDVGSILKENER
jgi:hypothetical protein